jgi:hypothetical protein
MHWECTHVCRKLSNITTLYIWHLHAGVYHRELEVMVNISPLKQPHFHGGLDS